MSAACDASMPRSVSGGRHNRCVYWWTPNIAEMRASCVRARKRPLRARRRRRIRDEAEITRYYEAYRETRRTLQREIKIVKPRSWTEIVESVESDPRGRPYRLVTEKFDLRPHSPLTTHMDPMLLANVMGTLFPRQDNDARQSCPSSSSSGTTTTTKWGEELRVTEEEFFEATKRMAFRNAALDPDGIPGWVRAESINTLAPRLRHLFTRCTREGVYPRT